MANYGDTMAYLRKRSKLTQEEAAKKIGISRSSLANYEKGLRRPSFEIMEAIADFYNVNMDTIFGHVDNPFIQEKSPSTDYQQILSSLSDKQLDSLLVALISDRDKDYLLQLAAKILEIASKK